jgi:hypothetical protein
MKKKSPTPTLQLELPLAASPAPRRTHHAVVPGQAHFCGTGPVGLTCRQCLHWAHEPYGYAKNGHLQPARCRKTQALTNRRGAKVPPDASACKHYAPAESVPAKFISPSKLKRGF